ncbi:universal stress protein [Oxynema aestuarii]|jgi:nucleotide-binding universal stress UspA family protein|uniref:Universal stress protein n=1 Tax=Oxynema aestuarii AP17 TaxID=2064643 RepID=A0A6H1U2Y2_9CYAN|nr:universal stress protein [Oxynema aestuarii]QIZ73238.1 universal stress protein [Oxynema aestuarii AP17]RMH76099.1 MAG: universal stress protein [Cyanobacteria bacterium J007]
MFRRLLVCTDFADGLHRLGNFLPNLAAGGIEQVVFLHAVPLWTKGQIPREDTEKMERARDRLSRSIPETVPEGVEVAVELLSGPPSDKIVKIAKKYQSDLIVLGTSHRNSLSENLFGSTTIELSGRTRIPLMTFPTELISALTSEELALRCQHLLRYIAIPYDGGDRSSETVERLKYYAKDRPANSLERCLLAWVVDAGVLHKIPKDEQLRKANETLVPIKADLEALGLQVDVEVRLGEPIVDILELAQMSDICAIAVSADNLSNLWDWLPSFRRELLRRSCEPIIFFPAHQD